MVNCYFVRRIFSGALLFERIFSGALLFGDRISKPIVYVSHKKNYSRSALVVPLIQSFLSHNGGALGRPRVLENKGKGKVWKEGAPPRQRRDSAQSRQKALSLIRIVFELPNEKEAVYGALDKWMAWGTDPIDCNCKGFKNLKEKGPVGSAKSSGKVDVKQRSRNNNGDL
ncbi:hypothetical protein QN277_005810 [Acacia crassicarpa]|uniref:Uncharacterized protein n=1 Tax=Acacia crassicarpa TaxID=499986 RepID=A0AAE1J0G3_9FABA|nr:hypothetical protein QN277_005810 [Acacia crassicarpa]